MPTGRGLLILINEFVAGQIPFTVAPLRVGNLRGIAVRSPVELFRKSNPEAFLRLGTGNQRGKRIPLGL